ncbi:RNA 2',3'-cyclic phosphodiesterase [Pseudorhodoplanes sp.]|jgi:2'-5' RNA ligase|uniref:RNA 2',3'-cyclic phosphodiesterase n=1 Tax=Pseudorhodoplanes sp. TaxID=1934341 RepID=UPI002D01F877|nr:RNA 2',3'-cyclic phosphodiesterase [Pseudorhodoplanes sp.]HWV43104.1 RNA 2',3'-cyclic phosphodiesterase [Pseudorhodoplanes sp.]
MPRIFTAIEIPADVAQMLTFLRGGLPGARWIDQDNYHITLRFIGDVDVNVAQDVASMLDSVNRAPFELRLEGLASFGGKKPRAVFAEVAPSAALMELQAEHERLMQRVGLEPEGRKYTPHVTLARLRDSSSRQVADYLSERGSFRSAPFRVERFVLYSSRASVGGGPYVVEEAYPLSALAARRAV